MRKERAVYIRACLHRTPPRIKRQVEEMVDQDSVKRVLIVVIEEHFLPFLRVHWDISPAHLSRTHQIHSFNSIMADDPFLPLITRVT